jgi:hypothetical protein
MAKMMTAILKDEEVLERAIAGLLRVEAIASMPSDDRVKALEAAERSYRETALLWATRMPRRQAWVATVMASLRAEVEKQLSPAGNAFLPMAPSML